MPKIIIKEYDKTKAGTSAYTNFSVVVPVLVRQRMYDSTEKAFKFGGKTVFKAATQGTTDKGENIFDENGVYECSSLADFENTIGKVPTKQVIVREGVGPTVESKKKISESKYNEGVAAGTLYRFEEKDPNEPIGELVDNENVYYRVTELDTWDADELYATINSGNEGVDGVKGEHMGNQIVHELLKLGYTVLIKKIAECLADETALINATSLSTSDFWKELKDKAIYDFRHVVTGLVSGNEGANEQIINLATFVNPKADEEVDLLSRGRGDCTALVDIDREAYIDATSQADAISKIKEFVGYDIYKSKYAAIFAPTITYKMTATEKKGYDNSTFPASFHYLACAARAAENYNEWYAIAGYNRGISRFTIESVGFNFGEAAIDALQPRYQKSGLKVSVNLITKVKNEYFLWGNRTAEELGSKNTDNGDLRASHFLNIRQLCSTIKKQVYVACRKFTFDPNSDVLWINFCSSIRPTLEKMKADQGIGDYKFVKVATDKKALLAAKIRITPIEAVEDFDISLTLEDSISGVTTGIDEE